MLRLTQWCDRSGELTRSPVEYRNYLSPLFRLKNPERSTERSPSTKRCSRSTRIMPRDTLTLAPSTSISSSSPAPKSYTGQRHDKDPSYVLAFFDLGNVLDELERPDESIAAYQRAVELAPRYADAHYNLALAFERKGERRAALRHWQTYARLDKRGPWAEHALGQIRKLLETEKLSIATRATKYIAPGTGKAALHLISRLGMSGSVARL